MKLHRFYVKETKLESDFWLQDKSLFHQWVNVLRFDLEREVSLFNDYGQESLYRIIKIGNDAVHLRLITEMKPKFPKNEIYLCFSLLKKDNNDYVLQKATELGVSHFAPIICDRTIKTGFDLDRAKKIVIEASEQCGRTDIPRVREPIRLETALEELKDKFELIVAEQGASNIKYQKSNIENSIAVFIGPEGGWSTRENEIFNDKDIKRVSISEFTLRAETACIVAASLLQ